VGVVAFGAAASAFFGPLAHNPGEPPRRVVIDTPTGPPSTQAIAVEDPVEESPSSSASSPPSNEPATPSPIVANGESNEASISDDGRFVAFSSRASNLTPHDDNEAQDIFWRDRVTRRTTLVSVSETGEPLSNASAEPRISGDGRFVAFTEYSTKQAPEEGPYLAFVPVASFIYDTSTHSGRRLPLSRPGSVASLSRDGRYAATVEEERADFYSVFEIDTMTGDSTRVSPSEGASSFYAGMSSDGRYVAFTSHVTDFDRDTISGGDVIHIYDRVTSTTKHVSLKGDGQARDDDYAIAWLSRDGRHVVFTWFTGEPVFPHPCDQPHRFYVMDIESGDVACPETGGKGPSHLGAESADASQIVLSGADGSRWLWRRDTGDTTRIVSCNDDEDFGTASHWELSWNSSTGEAILSVSNCALAPHDSPHRDVFVHDLGNGTIEVVSVPDGS
jgi:hypothetical protein